MNRSFKRSIFLFTFFIGFVFLISAEAIGQRIRVRGGDPTMTITTGIAGGQLQDVINTDCSLRYTTPRNPNRRWKITVGTICLGQSFYLSVVATNATRGTEEPEVSLSDGSPAVDLVTSIPRNSNNARCTLQYTASAVFAQGNSNDVGNDVHTVTYTLQLE